MVEVRLSRSDPSRGIVRFKSQTFNQNDEVVMEQVAVPGRSTTPDDLDASWRPSLRTIADWCTAFLLNDSASNGRPTS